MNSTGIAAPSRTAPEGVATVSAEGADLKIAVAAAAKELGLHPSQLDYKMDLSHFRSSTGASVARRTVAVIAWNSGREVSEAPPPAPKRERPPQQDRSDEGAEASGEDDGRKHRRRRSDRPERGERGDRDRGDRGDRGDRRERSDRGDREDRGDRGDRDGGKPETLRGAEAGPTDASDFAQAWFTTLLELMDVEGTVVGTGSDERVHLAIKAERAGRIVGKRGATLGSIRHLLSLALQRAFPDRELTVDVDVGDDRPREDRAPRERGERSDRGDRRGRDRDRDRDRGGRGRDRGDRGGEKGRYPEDKLRALARRAAEKAAETGQTITINLELNSFDRRIVHLEVSEIDGVQSQSEERKGDDGRLVKYVQIIPDSAE